MDSMSAFARGEENRGKPQMVFDWDKAVKIILENGYKNCGAGLTVCVTYRYKQTEYDYEWFMEDELSVVTDELEK